MQACSWNLLLLSDVLGQHCMHGTQNRNPCHALFCCFASLRSSVLWLLLQHGKMKRRADRLAAVQQVTGGMEWSSTSQYCECSSRSSLYVQHTHRPVGPKDVAASCRPVLMPHTPRRAPAFPSDADVCWLPCCCLRTPDCRSLAQSLDCQHCPTYCLHFQMYCSLCPWPTRGYHRHRQGPA